jgi:phospholipid-translocating ATPase
MSDIPLASIRRNGKGYTRISDTDSNSDHPSSMPATVRAAASSTSARRAAVKGKRKDKYMDDPEEQAGLLGDDQLNDEQYEDHDGNNRQSMKAVQTTQVGLCTQNRFFLF